MADHADATAGPGGLTLDGRWCAIEAEGLVKAYGETRALEGLDLIADAGLAGDPRNRRCRRPGGRVLPTTPP
jgi:hypothetical protein